MKKLVNFLKALNPRLLVGAVICCFILLSCKREYHKPVIVTKTYLTFSGDKMPDCICNYWYKVTSFQEAQMFQDSCSKYNVGDTIFP